jgi:hypothetical protein
VIIHCFAYILISILGSTIIGGIGAILTFLFQGKEAISPFFMSYAYHFNGCIIGGFGFGTLWFILRWGPTTLYLTNTLFEFPESLQSKYAMRYKRLNSPFWLNVISIPITIAGCIILYRCEYPLHGFSKWYLAITSMSLYYLHGLGLAMLIYTIRLFRLIERHSDIITISPTANPMDLDTLKSFITVSSTMLLVSGFIAFRGTLTANFLTTDDTIRLWLLFPVFLGAPIILFYSFYCRSVLRQVYRIDIARRLTMLSNKLGSSKRTSALEEVEAERTLLEIEERLRIQMDRMSVLRFKDSPAIITVILMLAQIIIRYDKSVNRFVSDILGY